MRAHPTFIAYFYILIISGLGLIVASVRLRTQATEPTTAQTTTQISIPLVFFEFKVPLPFALSRTASIRIFLCSVAFVMFGLAACTNFGNAFPRRMNISVFYDLQGITQELNAFSLEELNELKVPPDWIERQTEYDATIRRSLGVLWAKLDSTLAMDTAYVRRDYLYAVGETTFEITRLGFLYYKITSSEGTLRQVIQGPGIDASPFFTFFELRESRASYLRSDIIQLLQHPVILLKPEFQQSISLEVRHSPRITFEHIVIGATKIHLFPHPRFSSTVYLWVAPDGMRIPIGYSFYSPYR